MSDYLLWNLDETARQLGGVSARTVRRLIARGALPMVRVGRCVRVPASAVQDYVASTMTLTHNAHCAEPGVRKEYTCHTVAKIVPFGGSVTSTRAAKELGDLLKLPIARKQKG